MSLEYLRHILDEVNYIVEHTRAITRQEFMQDATLRRAVVRSLEVIGEATKHIPNQFRAKYPRIDWRSMAAMRDKLIHDYFGVDYEIVWDVVVHKVPSLKQEVEEILRLETNQ
ncbi:MAG: DUF86 domain-containing protein [Anaerolineae bacterium]|nr:DUF86 domain-containing protein [Anaerolineae bacterium]